jgi:hypothetical protein
MRELLKVNLPEGTSGDWKVEHFTVSKEQASFGQMRSVITMSARHVPSGTYTGLWNGRSLVMSDTPDEIRDHLFPIHEATRRGGHVLINGLGLGMVAAAILEQENVEKVTVVELSREVIDLVGPTLMERYGDRLEIIHADALEYLPRKGQRFTVVWHDIWPDICTDNLPEMGTLHRRYGKRADWQGSWCRELLKSEKRRERSAGW